MLSIIIPTLNEEKYLPLLLESINKQKFRNYEIIVADNRSKDNTRKIARRYSCKIVEGGLPPIARNNGAYASAGNMLLFLDADVVLDEGFLKSCLKEFRKRKLDLASVLFKIPKKPLGAMLLSSANLALLAMQKLDPHATGSFILCKRKIFMTINGFNERLKLAEDHDFVKRASTIGKFGILRKTIPLSMRRFDKEGMLSVMKKYAKSELYRQTKGEISESTFEYEYGRF